MRAALYVAGRVVTGNSHLDCFNALSESEQNTDMDSGFYDAETGQFISDRERQVFDDKEIYLVRHGQSTNPDDPDPDITQQGEQEIRQAASCLSGRNIEHFQGFVSPLLRCLRTASILNRTIGINFEILPEIMETPHFLSEGQIFKVKNRSWMFPEFHWPTSKEWHILPESASDFYGRVKETLQHFPPRSIVITHYGYICLTAKIALCKPILNEGFPPASVTYFNRHDGKRLGWTNEEICQDRPKTADRKVG